MSSNNSSKKSSLVSDNDENESGSDTEQEDILDYKKGGYHCVLLGDYYCNRYEIIRKIGWGHFSTVWLINDQQKKSYSALKVVKSSSHYTEAALDEIKMLKKVYKADSSHNGYLHVIHLLDDFKIVGANGLHIAMVFELLGCNLLKLIVQTDYKGLPLNKVKTIINQTLLGLSYLHDVCSIIHTDIKPENILLYSNDRDLYKLLSDFNTLTDSIKKQTPIESSKSHSDSKIPPKNSLIDYTLPKNFVSNAPRSSLEKQYDHLVKNKKYKKPKHSSNEDFILNKQIDNISINAESFDNIKVKIADLGNSCWFDHHFTDDIQTRQYRSPEVIIGAGYNETCDIWSTACMAFELAIGEYLFDPKSGKNFSRDDDHLAIMLETIEPFDKSFYLSGKYSDEFFSSNGSLKHIKSLKPMSIHEILTSKYEWSNDEALSFSQFLLPMLTPDYRKRATASQCLKEKWLNS